MTPRARALWAFVGWFILAAPGLYVGWIVSPGQTYLTPECAASWENAGLLTSVGLVGFGIWILVLRRKITELEGQLLRERG